MNRYSEEPADSDADGEAGGSAARMGSESGNPWLQRTRAYNVGRQHEALGSRVEAQLATESVDLALQQPNARA